MSAEAPARRHERDVIHPRRSAASRAPLAAHTGALTDGEVMLVAVPKEVFGVGL